MHKDDEIRLRHMLDAAREATFFVRGSTRSDLNIDRKLALALVKNIEIVGEAATKITEFTRRRLPELPWEQIVGMRHRLVLDYSDINLDIVWKTTQEELPELIAVLESAISPEPHC